MQDAATTLKLTRVEAAALQCVVYADLFDFALTPEEVWRWLPVQAGRAEVSAALKGPRLTPLLLEQAPYVTLTGRQQNVAIRRRRRDSSAALRATGRFYGRLIGRLPFVRMVALTGSLAVDNADPGDDLDYLVITAPGRVWLTRAMIMALGRLARLRGVTLCPNYLLADTALALPERDYYTAREFLQMLPVAGEPVYQEMLAANTWVARFLPNAAPVPAPAQRPTPAPPPPAPGGRGMRPGTRRVVEAFLRLPPFDTLERTIMARKSAELQRQAGSSEAVFDETMCKGHFEGWRERTRLRVDERLREILGGSK